ncbi:MAG: hypothetical protein ACI9GM_000154 [Salibacteraceae bacterium]|jgi:hypothetical protein
MKNVKNIIAFVVLIGLTALVAYNYFTTSSSTIQSTANNFSIEDTGSIDKIFIADMNGNQIVLERVLSNQWTINSQYTAVQNNINNLLETVNLMTVKAPVAKARYDKTIRDLSTVGIKVELYQGSNTPSRVIYIGTANQHHTGNYMMIEGSNLPYLVHIEGFNGFLSPRFSTHENDWKSKTVFRYNPKDIAELRLSYPGQPQKGFVIKQTIDGQVSLFTNALVPVEGWKQGAIVDYLERFREVNFEMWEETKDPIFIDSVSTSTPLEVYSITNMAGETTTLKTLLKPLKSGMDIEGNPIDHDQDRMYALLNEKEFMIIQYFVFDPLNLDIQYFYSNQDQ